MKRKILGWLFLVGFILALIGLWLFAPSMNSIWLRSGTCKDITEVSDSFGAYGALVSAFAFAGLIFTIIQQGKMIKIQQKELQQNTEELALQRKELEKQKIVLKAQATTAKLTTQINLSNNKMDQIMVPVPALDRARTDINQSNQKQTGGTQKFA
jgi:uncharacterized protein YoxC